MQRWFNLPGCTAEPRERFKRHINGYVNSTKSNLSVEVIVYCAFKEKYKAFQFEKYLKSGSGREFMNERLIDK